MAAQIFNVVIQLIFGAPPLRAQGFGVVALMRAAVTLNGARFMDFTSEAALRAARDATYIDSYTYETGVRVLQQQPRPPKFRVVRVDTAAGPTPETFDGILSAFLDTAEGQETFCYALGVETPAIALACANVLAALTRPKLLSVTTNDAAPLTSYAALVGQRLFTLDYDLDDFFTYNKGCVGMAARLAFDQDRRSPGFAGPVQGSAPSNSGITQAALEGLIDANVNVYAPRPPFTTYRYAGRQFDGTPTAVVVFAAWLQQRIDEATSAMLARLDAAGLQLPVTFEGQQMVMNEVEAVILRGVGLQKVVPGQYLLTAPEITPADIAAERIPVEAEVQLSTPATKIAVTLTVSQLPIIPTEV